MHELSIALSMIEQADQAAAAYGGEIRSVSARIGILSGVDVEALRFAWVIARAGTRFAATDLRIDSVPLVVRCPACGQTHAAQVDYIACPNCITPEQQILAGRELELTSLEIDE